MSRPRTVRGKIAAYWRSWRASRRDLAAYRRRYPAEAPDFPISRVRYHLSDRFHAAGVARGAYFHHDLLVAQAVFEAAPRRVLDVGSRVDGFVAHVASFREIETIDIRPLATRARNIRFVQADIFDPDLVERVGQADYVTSLSVIEHFGLGRYGDPLDPRGHERGLSAIAALVEPGGILHIAVPTGRQRVEFHLHRVFAPGTIPALLGDAFRLEELTVIDADGELVPEVSLAELESDPRWDVVDHYYFTIYRFRRTAPGRRAQDPVSVD